MDLQAGSSQPAQANMDQSQAPKPITTGISDRRALSATNSPISSAPPTPNPNSFTSRQPVHPATSPLHQNSPKVVRRTSSAMGLNERPTSSPNPSRRKSSRMSLGDPGEEEQKRLNPKRSISNLISGLREAQSRMESIEEPLPLTAPQIAADHFSRELAAHIRPESEAETVVILHDACYGHRYSRLKTTKTALSMIVERPERIHASVLGASTAYVRLGGHHAGEKNAPHPARREAAAPPFKILRTARTMDVTSSHVTNVHGVAWMSELHGMCSVAGEKLAAGAKELSRSATPTDPEKRTLHEGDLYLCAESLNAFQGALGGVAEALDAVFDPASRTRRAFVAIRPPGHHCSADYPSGFCWLNNVHVGIEYAAQTYGLTHAAILDFDLHHGDGSQAIAWERNSKNNGKRLAAKPNTKLKLAPDIGYYSLHDINSYPCEMGDDEKVQAASLCIENAHGQNIWNVHLQPWKTEREFWELYETRYRVLLDKARAFLQSHTARIRAEGKIVPRAALFISAGFDASEWEGSGMQRHKVNVPTEFYARFTRDMVDIAREASTGCDGRVISVLEGGYSDRALCSGVLSHLSGLCATPVEEVVAETSGMDSLDQMMRGLGINGAANSTIFQYNKDWWSPFNLTALEMKVNPPPPAQAKKTRVGQQPTYATPTESFAYKVVDANKFARSISGTMREVQPPPRPLTPPPSEVDWVVATQELSKLLIPTDRQTKSCTPEELAGPKVKKEHPSAIPPALPTDSGKPRQLRDRKSKALGYPESTHSDETESLRSVSRSSRRQTIAELPSASNQPEPSQQRRASRRLSAGSALGSLGGDLDTSAPPVPAVPSNMARPAPAMQPPPVPARDVQVKKTRMPVKKEATSSAPASPKRATKVPARLSGPAGGVAAPSNHDVDALAAGMKKVTLKVGTREEHDRKQKEKLDAERRARALKGAETRKANAAAKKAARESAVTRPTSEQVSQKENAIPAPASADADMMVTPAHTSQPNQLASTDMASTLTQPAMPSYPHAEIPGDSVVQQPSVVAHGETAAPPHEIQHENLLSQQVHDHAMEGEWNPPQLPASVYEGQSSTEAPRVSMGEYTASHPAPAALPSLLSSARSPNGAKLPAWTSTGVIPFSVANEYRPLSANTMEAVPTNTYIVPPDQIDLNDTASKIHVSDLENESWKSGQQGPSVWDVPETPQR